VSLSALNFLHEQRHILLDGHEPLDIDDSPDPEVEAWLTHHRYAQADGVAHLDQVPEVDALVAIGFARYERGTGGDASFTAICPPDCPTARLPDCSTARLLDCSPIRRSADPRRDAPLPRSHKPLHWEAAKGARKR